MLLSIILITGCTSKTSEELFEPQKATTLTIKPHKLNKQEIDLVNHTGIDYIDFYELDGTLKGNDDIHLVVDVYEKGKLVEEQPFTSNVVQYSYDHSIWSIGLNKQDNFLEIIHGVEDGYMSSSHEVQVQGYTMDSLLTEKVKLKKNKPVPLFAWAGTNGNGISSINLDENGNPAGGIGDSDLAYVYKIILTERVSKKETE